MTKPAKDSKTFIKVATDLPHLASQRQQGLELIEFLRSRPCATPTEEQWFSAQRATVGALIQKLEDERTGMTKPLLASKAKIDAMFKPATQPLKDCEAIIMEKLASAARVRLALEAETRRAAQAAVDAGNHAAAITALAAAPAAVATTGSSARVVRKWRVVDLAAVPREFLVLNETAADAACKAGTPVPGIEYYDDVAVRRK